MTILVIQLFSYTLLSIAFQACLPRQKYRLLSDTYLSQYVFVDKVDPGVHYFKTPFTALSATEWPLKMKGPLRQDCVSEVFGMCASAHRRGAGRQMKAQQLNWCSFFYHCKGLFMGQAYLLLSKEEYRGMRGAIGGIVWIRNDERKLWVAIVSSFLAKINKFAKITSNIQITPA